MRLTLRTLSGKIRTDLGGKEEALKKLAAIEDICDDVEQIRQAMEKAKARKVKTEKSDTIGINVRVCPNCKVIAIFGYGYCRGCGQKLDWSE